VLGSEHSGAILRQGSQPGDNHIKTVIRKGKRCHIARVHFDTIRHALGDSVALGGFGTIARLIGTSPQVHAHRPARGQVLRSQEQDCTPATSQVQDALITPEVQLVEQFGPNHELASPPRVEDEGRNRQQE
jgi:hypothetical protein